MRFTGFWGKVSWSMSGRPNRSGWPRTKSPTPTSAAAPSSGTASRTSGSLFTFSWSCPNVSRMPPLRKGVFSSSLYGVESDSVVCMCVCVCVHVCVCVCVCIFLCAQESAELTWGLLTADMLYRGALT